MSFSEIFSNVGIIFQEPWLILLVAAGIWVGMYVGAIPGLTGTMAASLLISFTYTWDVLPALAVMVGVHVGCAYGGSRAAILINIPGAPCAIATAFDGYPMAKKGLAAKALVTTLVQSVLGGILATMIFLAATPLISKIALQFASRDYLMLAMMGLLLVATLGNGSTWKSLFSGALGLLIGCVGMDATFGTKRFTFGITYLQSGIGFVVAMIGLFGFAEILMQARDIQTTAIVKQNVEKLKIDFHEIRKHWKLTLTSSVLGAFIGALPGTGGDIAALFAYDTAKRMTKNPEVPFGEGAMEGLIAPESANNATVPAAYIPMLTLGIPGDGYAAIVIGALYIHGLNPGPTLPSSNPEIVGVIAACLILSNLFLLIAGFTGIKAFAKIVEIPKSILLPIIAALCVIGSYALNRSMVDVCIMVGFGIVGYMMRRHDFPVAPMILGIILCQLFEWNFRRMLQLSHNSMGQALAAIFGSPISTILFLALVTSILIKTPVWSKLKSCFQKKGEK